MLDEGRAVLPRFPFMAFRFHWLVGELALAEGDGEQAARAYRAALTDRLAVGDPVGVAISVLGLAKVAAVAGNAAWAARLPGGSEWLALAVGGSSSWTTCNGPSTRGSSRWRGGCWGKKLSWRWAPRGGD